MHSGRTGWSDNRDGADGDATGINKSGPRRWGYGAKERAKQTATLTRHPAPVGWQS